MASAFGACEVCGEDAATCGCSAYYDERDRKRQEFLVANGHDPNATVIVTWEHCPECGTPCKGHTSVQDYLRIAGLPNQK